MTLVLSRRCEFPGVSIQSEGYALVNSDPEGNSERRIQQYDNTFKTTTITKESRNDAYRKWGPYQRKG